MSEGVKETPQQIIFYDLVLPIICSYDFDGSNIYIGTDTISLPEGELKIEIYPPHLLMPSRKGDIPSEENVDEVVLEFRPHSSSAEFVGISCSKLDGNDIVLHITSSRIDDSAQEIRGFELNITIKDGEIEEIWYQDDEESSVIGEEKRDEDEGVKEVIIKSDIRAGKLLQELLAGIGLSFSFKEGGGLVTTDGDVLDNFEQIIKRMCNFFRTKKEENKS